MSQCLHILLICVALLVAACGPTNLPTTAGPATNPLPDNTALEPASEESIVPEPTVSELANPLDFSSSPSIANCPVFPANNIWNIPIDQLPTHPNSANYIAAIGANSGAASQP